MKDIYLNDFMDLTDLMDFIDSIHRGGLYEQAESICGASGLGMAVSDN